MLSHGRQGAISAVLNEEDLAKNPEQIFKNTKRLQKLAMSQVIAMTLTQQLDFIISEPPHSNDRIM